MNSKSKRQNNTGATTDNDRLSSLPESLRLHILSLVPTKYAARTSLLSRNWRDLFLDTPRIELEYSPPVQTPAGNSEFVRFINRRLMLGSSPPPPIDEFRLISPTLSKNSSLDVWLAILLRRGIKVLEIQQLDPNGGGLGVQSQISRYQYPAPYYVQNYYPVQHQLGYLHGYANQHHAEHLYFQAYHHGYADHHGYPPVADPLYPPAGFFQSKTLVVLKFRGGSLSFDSRGSVCFPNLKVLSLESLMIHINTKTLRFSKLGYPVLEDLELKKLQYSRDHEMIAIEISSQTLKKMTIVNLNPLQFTRIDIDASHLQHLEFQDINRVPADSLPEFPELTYLGFQKDYSSAAGTKGFLWDLLHGTPNLEKLSFDMDEFGPLQMLPSAILPQCFTRKLRVVSLRKCKGTEAQVALVEWLLNLQGAVLEKIVVEGKIIEWPSSTVNRLLKIAQLHPKCEIVLLDDPVENI